MSVLASQVTCRTVRNPQEIANNSFEKLIYTQKFPQSQLCSLHLRREHHIEGDIELLEP